MLGVSLVRWVLGNLQNIGYAGDLWYMWSLDDLLEDKVVRNAASQLSTPKASLSLTWLEGLLSLLFVYLIPI